jgi:triacylglycerol lipase
MVSKFLKTGAVLEALAAIVLARLLVLTGVPLWLAVLLAVLLPLAVHAVPLAIEFIVGAIVDRRPVARLGFGALVSVWWNETWRSFTVFNIDQAWRSRFPERPLVRDATRPSVLLVHGYICNRGTWRRWLLDGIPQHWNVATVNLEPIFGQVEEYSEGLHDAVERLRAATGAERVTLVCHSMGGLATRSYLRSHGHHAVGRVITIDTPHHGTIFAPLGHGHNAVQMRAASDFVRELATDPEPIEFVCFASQHDNLVVPRDSQILECAEAVWFERIGHLAMTTSDEVLRKLIEVVERRLPEAAEAHAGAAAAVSAVEFRSRTG